jgi:G:T-mismatch repair DNA endonuclease (very short patch repair protein)
MLQQDEQDDIEDSDESYKEMGLSKELMDKERSYRLKNKQLSSQVNKVLQQAEYVVVTHH